MCHYNISTHTHTHTHTLYTHTYTHTHTHTRTHTHRCPRSSGRRTLECRRRFLRETQVNKPFLSTVCFNLHIINHNNTHLRVRLFRCTHLAAFENMDLAGINFNNFPIICSINLKICNYLRNGKLCVVQSYAFM